MKILKLLIVISFFNSALFGQVAIDFTEIDINGVEQNLFSYLEDGKVVVIDAFTTDCGPCWTLHKQKVLEQVHNILGPEGMDKVVVFGFEFSTSTDEDDLYGLGDNTFGDFITGTPYPIFNPDEISQELRDAYVNLGYPTMNIICPQSMEVINSTGGNYYWILQELPNCISLPEFSDLVPVKFNGLNEVCSSFEPVFSILNGGTTQINSLKLNLLKEGVLVQEGLNYGAIAGGQYRVLQMNEISIDGDASDFTVEIAVEDDYPDNNALTTTVNKAVTINKDLILYLETKSSFAPIQDSITCIIETVNGNIVYESSNLEYEMILEDELTLSEGECYTFKVNGSHSRDFFKVIELRDINEFVLPLDYYIDNGKLEFSTDFQNSLESLNEDINIIVYPSPANDFLSLEINDKLNENIQLRIFQMSGRLKYYEEIQFINETNEKKIDVSNYTPGVYIIQFQTETSLRTMKFFKI